MLIKHPVSISENEVTDFTLYQQRREFLKALGGIGLLSASGLPLLSHAESAFATDEAKTPYDDVTSYNNFYEFGTDKSDPARYASTLKTSPWSITVDGECAKPGKLNLEDILKPMPSEERIYRLRCVEGWSMVIPWQGFPLATLLKRFEPTSKAKYVRFETLFDPKQMPGQARDVLDWPYVEGLRMDEAMHPLSFMATGLYGKTLPNQSGAPIRLVVPWNMALKALNRLSKLASLSSNRVLVGDAQPRRNMAFTPMLILMSITHVGVKRKERRIGEFRKRATLPFNGYAEQVASLYSGMDLRKNF